jgi:hypothetical protein
MSISYRRVSFKQKRVYITLNSLHSMEISFYYLNLALVRRFSNYIFVTHIHTQTLSNLVLNCCKLFANNNLFQFFQISQATKVFTKFLKKSVLKFLGNLEQM